MCDLVSVLRRKKHSWALSHDNREWTDMLTINKWTYILTNPLSEAVMWTEPHTQTYTYTQNPTFLHLLSPFPVFLFSINLYSLSILSHYLLIFSLLLLQSLSSSLQVFSPSHLFYSFSCYPNLPFSQIHSSLNLMSTHLYGLRGLQCTQNTVCSEIEFTLSWFSLTP